MTDPASGAALTLDRAGDLLLAYGHNPLVYPYGSELSGYTLAGAVKRAADAEGLNFALDAPVADGFRPFHRVYAWSYARAARLALLVALGCDDPEALTAVEAAYELDLAGRHPRLLGTRWAVALCDRAADIAEARELVVPLLHRQHAAGEW